jgi:pimeloyl-ACP methyl ester carboxylesterase
MVMARHQRGSALPAKSSPRAARIAHLVANAAGDVHLVGHSYGGAIALRIALRHPESIASVAVYEPVALRILFDYNSEHPAAAEVAEVAEEMLRALSAGKFEDAARCFIDYWSGAEQWGQLTPERQAAIARRTPVIHAHFCSLVRDVIRLPDYVKLDVPVLHLTGRETRASARQIGELLESALPDVESITLNAMGHLGPITHAEIVAKRVGDYVRRQANAPIVHDLMVA